MAAGSHLGCPKITLYRISYHFRYTIFIFVNFFYKMAAGADNEIVTRTPTQRCTPTRRLRLRC